MSHHKGGFEPETNGFQFYAIANLDKTSLLGISRTINYDVMSPPPRHDDSNGLGSHLIRVSPRTFSIR